MCVSKPGRLGKRENFQTSIIINNILAIWYLLPYGVLPSYYFCTDILYKDYSADDERIAVIIQIVSNRVYVCA